MPALIFLNSYKIWFGLFLSLYFIFKYLHFRGLRKEFAFDTFFVFICVQILIQKLYYFYLNYQNFPSIYEIIWNTDLAPDAFFLGLVLNFVISYFLSRKYNFSIYHLIDSLNISYILLVIFYTANFDNLLKETNIIYLSLLFLILLIFKQKLISGFFSFSFVFLVTTFSVIYSFSTNNLIFYIILNTMNALLIFRRGKYMESNLSNDFIESSKNKLLARRAELVREIEDLDHKEPRDMGDSDYIDEVMDDLEIENGKLNKRFLSKVLEKVDRALKRIEDGKYGYDQKTGKQIDKSRLELFPEAEEDVR